MLILESPACLISE
uniref:Uncharacterized protein n=1 Tax=Arundo donax TaxID=35708 RepID=A0A0A9H352_ARUDO